MQDSTMDEQREREAALDETIENSFPASDPPSSDPNPLRWPEANEDDWRTSKAS